MTAPLVSVVVAAYDRTDMLRQTLASVLAQTWPAVEVLVRDDSPHDRCAQVVAELDDPRLHYRRNNPSLGTMANHLAGYREARGAYLTTLNDDDLHEPTYLETMIEGLERHPEASLAFANHSIVDAQGIIDPVMTREVTERFGRARLTTGLVVEPARAALVDRAIPGMFAVVRASAVDLDDFPHQVSSGYDFWLVYLAVREGRPAYFDSRLLTAYRAHSGSQTSSFGVDVAQRLRSERYMQFIDRRILADPRLAAVHVDVRRRLARGLVSSGMASLDLGHRRDAVRDFAASLCTRPTARAAVGLSTAGLPRWARNTVLGR